MYKITDISNDKVNTFNSDELFVDFVQKLCVEKCDDMHFVVHNVETASDYLDEYCENLDLDINIFNIPTLLENVISDAQEAFWEVIAKNHPEIKSGDFPPDEHHNFGLACKRAVDVWLKFNQVDVTKS